MVLLWQGENNYFWRQPFILLFQDWSSSNNSRKKWEVVRAEREEGRKGVIVTWLKKWWGWLLVVKTWTMIPVTILLSPLPLDLVLQQWEDHTQGRQRRWGKNCGKILHSHCHCQRMVLFAVLLVSPLSFGGLILPPPHPPSLPQLRPWQFLQLLTPLHPLLPSLLIIPSIPSTCYPWARRGKENQRTGWEKNQRIGRKNYLSLILTPFLTGGILFLIHLSFLWRNWEWKRRKEDEDETIIKITQWK